MPAYGAPPEMPAYGAPPPAAAAPQFMIPGAPAQFEAPAEYAPPAPVYQDSAPVYQDSAPVYQDSAPVYQDSAPVYQDSAPAYSAYGSQDAAHSAYGELNPTEPGYAAYGTPPTQFMMPSAPAPFQDGPTSSLARDTCGDGPASSHDGGSHDGGSHDGGSHDGGSHDGGSHDGGSHDGGSHDGGSHDGGFHDGGFPRRARGRLRPRLKAATRLTPPPGRRTPPATRGRPGRRTAGRLASRSGSAWAVPSRSPRRGTRRPERPRRDRAALPPDTSPFTRSRTWWNRSIRTVPALARVPRVPRRRVRPVHAFALEPAPAEDGGRPDGGGEDGSRFIG